MDKQMAEYGAERLHLADEYSRLKQQHSETSWWSSVSPLLDSYQQLVQIMSERSASFVKLYSGLVCPNCRVLLESESSTDDGSLNSSVSSVISMLHGKSKSDCLPRDQLASGMSNCDCSSSVQLLTGKLVPECNGNSVGCNNAAGVSTRDAKCACASRLHIKENSDTCSVSCVAESSMNYGKNFANDEEVSAGLDGENCFSSNGVNHSNSASEMLSSCVMKRQSNETKDRHSSLDASDMQQNNASLSKGVVDNDSCQEIDSKVRDFKPDTDSVVQSIVCAADSLKISKSPSCDSLDDRQPVDLDKFKSELEKNDVDNRKQVIESTETYASIIGREIAASFSLHVDSSKSSCTGTCVEPDGCSCASFDEDLPPRLTNGFDHLISTQNGIQTVVPHDILKVDPDAMDLSPSLDTVEVAQKVRDVLTANNVGQRQFARHVLGLSQGTVSELLAKPKPWDRLSEKGRESYRRMHEWVGDQLGVTTLKTALRRKVDSLSILNLSKHDNDAKLATEQRIAQILSEAQRAMLQQQQPLQTELDIKNLDNVISVTVETGLKSSASSPATSSGKNSEIRPAPSRLKRDRRRGGATSSDAVTSSGTAARSGRRSAVLSTTEAVITTSTTTTTSPARDLVARIYEEELRKLIAAAELNGNASDVAMYNRELARLAFSKAGCSTGNCTSSGMESDAAEVAENKENCDGGNSAILREDSLSLDGPQDLSMSRNIIEQSEHCTTAVSDSSANSCLSSEDDEKQVGADGLSPLQRMQCIANSLPVAPSLSQASLTGQPSRPALPPISTEQLATCDDINTDDLVSKIKDVLGQFSISQRLFGEAVLGLSQGSVSDLLARPKPWPLLTQKGREPFVRMQAFLDDPDAISKLVATQYRVPADKLLRSNSSSDSSRSEGNAQLGSGSCTSLPPASTSSVVFTSFSPIASTSFRGPLQIDAALNGRLPEISPVPVNGCFSSLTGMPPLSGCTTPVMPGGVGSTVMPMGAAVFPFLPVASYFSSPPGHVAPMMMAVDFRQLFAQQLVSSVPLALTTNKVEKVEPLPSSEVFDTTLTGDEIDTQELTARVRDVLQANGLGQKLFGEAVLELSQGSVSELLAKPKPWNLLSAKGREPFLRMRTWLGDPQGIERLRTYQSQAVTGSKRKVSPDSGNESSSGQTVSTPQKRPRLFFTEDQKTALRNAYAADPYPNQAAIERLAADVGVGVKTVVNWFHNHRMRAKQQTTHGSSGDPCPASVASPSSGVSALNNSVPGELEEDTLSCEQSAILSKTRILSSPCLSDPACQFPDRTSTDAQNQMLTASIDGYNNIANRSTVINKRKRARPHRLLAQRTMREKVDGTTSECVCSNDSQPSGDRDVPIDLSVLHSASKSENIKADLASDGQDEATVSRASENTPLANDEWKDGDREKNIERLQKNLSQEPAEEWEF